MSSYQSMRESSISARLRALSSDAGPKSGNNSDKVAVVERTGPKVAEEVLHTEGKTVAPRADRMPRKAGGRAMPKHDDKAEDMKMMSEGHPDEKQDKAMIRKMVKPGALTEKKDGGRAQRAGGGPTLSAEQIRKRDQLRGMYARSQAQWDAMSDDQKREALTNAANANGGLEKWRAISDRGMKNGGRSAYADGGRAKGSTTINIVMPAGGGDKPMPMPVPMGAAPAPMPRPAPQMPLQGGAPAVSPTLALKTGGRATFTAGAGTGEGRLEKTEHAKARK